MSGTAQLPPQKPDRTYCQLPTWPFNRWDEHVSVAWSGSCFAERIGQRFADLNLKTLINPLGIGFNPVTISQMMIDSAEEIAKQLVFDKHRARWYSYQAHSRIYGETEEKLNDAIAQACEKRDQFLQTATDIVITLGTAWAWHHQDFGLVANCHKQPGQLFTRKLLSVQESIEALEWVIRQYPNARFILTVSPVRHTKETLHGNNLSKATLLLATAELVRRHPDQCWYFPSYELVIDDLRDYRYYEADLIHPNQQAIDYVWDAFGQQLFTEDFRQLLFKRQQDLKSAAHRAHE